MKHKLIGSIALSMVAMLFVSMMAILPARPSPADSMYIQPATSAFVTATTSVGDHFKIYVWVSMDTPTFAWQVKVLFNPTQLQAVATDYTGVGKSLFFTPLATASVIPVIDNIAGSVLHGESLQDNPQTPWVENKTGTGSLIWIEFEIMQQPTKFNKHLGSTFDITTTYNTGDTYCLDTGLATIPLTTTNGQYTFDWSAPTTNPNVAVRRADGLPWPLEFGPWPPSAVGSTFDVKVMIEGLESSWGLIQANLTIAFNATVIDFAGGVGDITLAPGWTLVEPIAITYNPDPTLDNVKIHVNAVGVPSGNVLVATLHMTVMMQKPSPQGDVSSPITFIENVLVDAPGPDLIPQNPPVNGQVIVHNLILLPPPTLKVDPTHTVLGPDLVVGDQFGKEFDVKVMMVNLHPNWYAIAVGFRLTYDDTLMQVVDVIEGPFFNVSGNRPAPPYTFFTWADMPNDPSWGDNVVVGVLILPSDTGLWSYFASGTGVIATIRFKAIKQSFVDTYHAYFNLVDTQLLGVDLPGDPNQQIVDIPYAVINGDYTILPITERGRFIDAWLSEYPAPYGGQGLNMPADIVLPQQQINITVKVTYNWWPVGAKEVAIEIRDPQGRLWDLEKIVTDSHGHAWKKVRMPWPDVRPEDLLGKWTIYATVDLADVVVTDIIVFDYDYLVRIEWIQTNKLEYKHLDTVSITVRYKTKSMRMRSVILSAMIQDELEVPIGVTTVSRTIGGAAFCTYKFYTDVLTIQIPWWAYAGLAIVRVDFFNKLPSEGGCAVTPEATKNIWILPL